MPFMNLFIQDARTQGVRLDLPVAGHDYAVELGPTTGFDAEVELGGSQLLVRSLSLQEQIFSGGSWQVADDARVNLSGSLVVRAVQGQGTLPFGDPLGFVGQLAVGQASAEGLGFVGAGLTVGVDFTADQIVIETAEDRGRRLEVGNAEAHQLTLEHDLGKVQVSGATLRGLRVALDQEGVLQAAIDEVQVGDVVIQSPHLDARIENVSLRQVALVDGRCTIGSIGVGRVSFALSDLGLPDPFEPSEAAPRRGPVKFEPPELPDIPLLDHLQGACNLDATVDLAVPIIKSRLATHRIRMDLIDGTFDFKRIEKGLSGLEDAVLDFEVKPGKLILEKDIPLIPFDNTTLVWWPLDPEEQQNAKKNKRVRLRRMLDFHLTDFVTSKLEAALNSTGGSSFFKVALNRLCLDNILVDISVGGASRFEFPGLGAVTFGTENHPAVRRFQLGGSVHFAPEERLEPTQVRLALQDAWLGLERLDLLGYSARVGAIQVAAIPEIVITFEEVVPDVFEGSIQGIGLEAVEFGKLALPALRF